MGKDEENVEREETPKPVRKKAAPKKEEKPGTYRVKAVTITYAGKVAQVGDLLDDIPAHSVKWLLEQDYIEKVDN